MKELLDYYHLPSDTKEFKIHVPTVKECDITERFLKYYGFKPLNILTGLKKDYVLYSVMEVYIVSKKYCYTLPDYDVDDFKKPPSWELVVYLENNHKNSLFKKIFFKI